MSLEARSEEVNMEYFLEKNGNFLFLRLGPGEKLIEGIKEACAEAGVEHGTITSCIGSLTKTSYTFVKTNAENITGIAYRDTIIANEPNEVISGQGTIGISGDKSTVHLHALMCDVDGKLFAGHMMPDCVVCATMEISIAVASSGKMVREFDQELRFPLFHFKKNA